MRNIIPYGRQNITSEDLAAVETALKSDFLTQGPNIDAFEEAFAEYVGAGYAVAVSNGTAALHLSAMALAVGENTNVITSPITFAASANCVQYCNGTVYFADIDPDTFCLDIKKVEELVLSQPEGFFQGIVPVDFAGYPVDLEAFRKLADKHNLWILEDACHAPGAYFTGSDNVVYKSGSCELADLAIFSFHPVKHIACGEGGMITTNSKTIYDRLRLLRSHGITKNPAEMSQNDGGWYYEMQELGYNYRLTDFQSALGLSQLKRADEGLEARKAIAKRYFEAFKDNDFIIKQSGVVEGHAYHLYIIQVAKRKELYDFLRTKNIFCQVHYIPVHTLPYYRNQAHITADLSLSEEYYKHCLSLPMYPSLNADEHQYVIDTIKEFFN